MKRTWTAMSFFTSRTAQEGSLDIFIHMLDKLVGQKLDVCITNVK